MAKSQMFGNTQKYWSFLVHNCSDSLSKSHFLPEATWQKQFLEPQGDGDQPRQMKSLYNCNPPHFFFLSFFYY